MIRSVRRWMNFVEDNYRLMFKQAQANLTAEDMQRIAGSGAADFPTDPQQIAGEFDFQLVFDAADLIMEYVMKKLDAITAFAANADRSGKVDWGKLMELGLYALDATWANAVIKDEPSANEAMEKEVQQDFLMMFAGNDPKYQEQDPAAQLKMGMGQELVKNNPKYAEAMETDEHFRDLVENWAKNKQQSVVQLGENKTTGRTGVKPVNQAGGPQ
jgi:hypothetical protein